MIRFVTDEDLDNHIIRGLRRRFPGIDIVRVQDVSLAGEPDAVVLTWAAETGRVLLTHDASTMTASAYARLEAGKPMPGVIVVPQWLSVGAVIEDLALIAECSAAKDWDGQVRFVPLR